MQRGVLVAVCLLILWTLYLFTAAIEEDLCRTLEFTQPIIGHALKGHVITNLTVKSPDACRINCYLESDCVSFNRGASSEDTFVCELSDSDRTKHPEDLELRQGFIYRGTKNPCSGDPCSSHGKCQNGFTDKMYRCVCEDGYSGEKCDKENVAWQKVNTDAVCFGAANGTHGSFRMTKTALIHGLKLVHKTGGLRCDSTFSPESFWGCTLSHYLRSGRYLLTLITHPNKTNFLPADDLLTGGNCGARYSYAISGVDHGSTELEFPPFKSSVLVSRDQEFQIWYGQDLEDCSDNNNSGVVCVDVYVLSA